MTINVEQANKPGYSAHGFVMAGGINFAPSSYTDTTLTMNNTAQGAALATGVTKIQVINTGAATEAIYVAFGTSELDAESNLNHSTDHATTGVYIGAMADVGAAAVQTLDVPSTATHYAVENAVAGDTQVVKINQGV